MHDDRFYADHTLECLKAPLFLIQALYGLGKTSDANLKGDSVLKLDSDITITRDTLLEAFQTGNSSIRGMGRKLVEEIRLHTQLHKS